MENQDMVDAVKELTNVLSRRLIEINSTLDVMSKKMDLVIGNLNEIHHQIKNLE